MQIIMIVLSLALLIWTGSADAQSEKTYSVSVSRHDDTPAISDQEIESILIKASKTLQKNDVEPNEPDNVRCNVAFKLEGPVRTFASPPASVKADHIDAMHRVGSDTEGVDFHVKIVKKIVDFCRFPNPFGFHGCAYPPNFRSIIVVHPQKHVDIQGQAIPDFPDHVLWAHEFGHLTGLGHRDEPLALMTPCPLTRFSRGADARARVTRTECRCLRSGPGFGPNGTCPLAGPVQCLSQW